LLGEKTRYDGGHVLHTHPNLDRWKSEGRIISFCPEVEGGFPIPRPQAEIIGGIGDAVIDGEAKVINEIGHDVTNGFMQGAQKALQIAQKNDIKVAVLKARSPSCGSKAIYNGTFTSTLIPGTGVTAALLIRNGILVFNEDEITEADKFLGRCNLSNA
jgi:uncharacterized protein YbbK (DUF523 family)